MLLKKRDFEFMYALPEDSQSIKELTEKISYPQSIDIQFRHGDDPYSSYMEEDKGSVIILVKKSEQKDLLGMGVCSYHEVYLDGEIKHGGYLNGLKSAPEYRYQFRYIPEAFNLMNEITKDYVDIYYAIIVEQAKETQRTFEKKRKNMPIYKKQCIITTFLFSPSKNTKELFLEKGNVEDLDAFYAKQLPKYNLAPTSRYMNGVMDDDFITWRKNGKILASCAIFNNLKHKNYFIKGYHGILKILPYLPTKLFGYPAVPKVNTVVNSGTMSMLMFDESVSIADRTRFIKAASSYGKAFNMIMVCVSDTDSTYEAFNKVRHIKYNGCFYTIHYGDEQDITTRPIYTDEAYI